MRVYKVTLVGLVLLLITACSAEPTALPTSTPIPVVQVRLDPVVEWLSPVIQTCSQNIPERNWLVLSTDAQLEDTAETSVHFYWDSEAPSSQNTYLITSDTVEVVTHLSLPLRDLTLSDLQAIFTGSLSRWDEMDENLPSAEIQVWLYPQSNSIMENFLHWSGLSPQSLSPLAFLAPDPLQMRNTIAENSLAIGILTKRWANEQVNLVKIKNEQMVREFPLVAELNKNDPYVQEWLSCIQNQIRH